MASTHSNDVPEPSREAFLHERLLISVDELATILNISPRTVWRLLSAGKLVRPLRIGGAVRWRYREIIDWIEAGCPIPND
jgi:excisionase family DNA binding protein